MKYLAVIGLLLIAVTAVLSSPPRWAQRWNRYYQPCPYGYIEDSWGRCRRVMKHRYEETTFRKPDLIGSPVNCPPNDPNGNRDDPRCPCPPGEIRDHEGQCVEIFE